MLKKNKLKQIDVFQLPIFPTEFILGFVALLFLSLVSANSLLTFYSLCIVPVLIALLWRKGEPPIFVFTTIFQWLQASTKVFHADFEGLPMEQFQEFQGTETAVWLSLTAVLVLALGIRFVLNFLPIVPRAQLETELKTLDTNRLFFVYIGVFIFTFLLDRIKFVIPQLSQIIVSVVLVKWTVFFIIGVKILLEGASQRIIIVIFLFEIVAGFTGYFSSFKEVFFYFFVTYLTIKHHIEGRTFIPLTFIATLLFVLAIFWSAVKDEYRSYVRAGDAGQVVNVSTQEQFQKLNELAGGFTDKHMEIGMNALLRRLAYVDFFGATIDYIPKYQPFEEGAVWGGALGHIFMPRLLFPDKPILKSDSEHTMKYTGLFLATDEQGTSISIGYVGDSYIDFGMYGMFVPIFLLGILWGLIYSAFVLKSKYKIVGMGFAIIVLMPLYQLEMASVKMLGMVVMAFLVMFTLMRFFEVPFFKILHPEAEDIDEGKGLKIRKMKKLNKAKSKLKRV